MEPNTRPQEISAEAAARDSVPGGEREPRGPGGLRPLPEDAIIILPVRNMVLFPGLVVPLQVGRDRSRAAAQEAVRLQRPIGILLQGKPEVEEPGPADLHWVGTTADVVRYVTMDDTHHAIIKGARRFRVLQFLEGYPFAAARVQFIEDTGLEDVEVEGR